MNIIVLGRKEIKKLLRMPDVIRCVENVYKAKAEGKTVVWPLVSYDFTEQDAVMDIRSGYLISEKIHGMKLLNNFPHNREKGLAPFNGMMVMLDSETGIPMGVMDASYITSMRTGAAAALGIKHLANPDTKRLLIVGAGKQSPYQVAAALELRPEIETVYISDPLNYSAAKSLTEGMPTKLKEEFSMTDKSHIEFRAVKTLEDAVNDAQAIITVTPARSPIINREWIKNGTHLSCVGADMQGKEEIDPLIIRDGRVFTDDKPQCIRVGEIEIPISSGVIDEAHIQGELGEVITGKIRGRIDESDITVFDATGLALLDLTVGKRVLELAAERGLGTRVDI